MGKVHDEHLTLLYFILLMLLAINYNLLLTLQFYIVMFFDVLFDHALWMSCVSYKVSSIVNKIVKLS